MGIPKKTTGILVPEELSHDVIKARFVTDGAASDYVRGDAYTNTGKGYRTLLRRRAVGAFQRISNHYIDQYHPTEIDFHHDTRPRPDCARTLTGLRKMQGKRSIPLQPKRHA